jgi:hypothetical protein
VPVDPKYIVNLQGKPYPTWPGVLDEAHRRGLVKIETDLLQIPSEENRMVAIVKAVATFEHQPGHTTEFSGIGDASPKNVGPRMVEAIIRFAETRAKGRALRDGCNIGETMAEELPHEEEKPKREARPLPGHRAGAAAAPAQDEAELKKVRQRYDDIRAERIALGLSDPGPWKPAWALDEAKRQTAAIFQDVAKKRKEQAPPPDEAPPAPPPAKEGEAKRRMELLAAWEQITKLAAGYGLTWTGLPRNPPIAVLESRGKALAETVGQVQADYESLDEMEDELAEFGIEYDPSALDRTKTDPYALRRMVDTLAERLDEAKNGPPPDSDVDPFAEEE